MITTRMAAIKEKLDKATSPSKPVHEDLASLSREFSDFKTFVWKALSLYKSQLELLSIGHERHEIHLRRKVLLIHGVPENNGEKVLDIVKKLITCQMGLSDVAGTVIQSCFRLGNNSTKPRPILLNFEIWNHVI